ncbi:MAG: peptidylprolyl isomerase, partial [Polyangiaceae bacterium]
MLAVAVGRLKRGDAFADVAREFSQDPGSAEQGGDVGDKTDGFVAPFRDAANALKPGETTTSAVETQFGYHLIERDDPAKTDFMAAALKKDAARELYIKEKTGQIAKDMTTAILASMKAGKSADDAAKEAVASLKGKSLPTVALTVMSAPAPAMRADAGANAASSKDAGAAIANSADGGAASVPDAPVTPKSFTSDNDPDRPQAQTSNDFNRGGDPIPGLDLPETTKVLDFAFGDAAKDGVQYPEPLRGEDAFYAITVKSHKAATKDEFEKDRDMYMQSLLAAKQAEALGLYVKRLREAAKADIKVDESYLNDAHGRDAGPDDLGEEDEEP